MERGLVQAITTTATANQIERQRDDYPRMEVITITTRTLLVSITRPIVIIIATATVIAARIQHLFLAEE